VPRDKKALMGLKKGINRHSHTASKKAENQSVSLISPNLQGVRAILSAAQDWLP